MGGAAAAVLRDIAIIWIDAIEIDAIESLRPVPCLTRSLNAHRQGGPETILKRRVRSGRTSLRDAQSKIAADRVAAISSGCPTRHIAGRDHVSVSAGWRGDHEIVHHVIRISRAGRGRRRWNRRRGRKQRWLGIPVGICCCTPRRGRPAWACRTALIIRSPAQNPIEDLPIAGLPIRLCRL
jgi:hypothetical protein